MQRLTAVEVRAHLNYCPETGVFTRKTRTSNRLKVGDLAGSLKPHGYIKIGVAGFGTHYAHRLAWLYMTGCWPIGTLDHRNGNRADNSFSNLREATHQQNLMNRPAKGSRFHPGLGRWTAQIGVNNKSIYLGAFDSEQAAHAAYVAAVTSIHGSEWAARKCADG